MPKQTLSIPKSEAKKQLISQMQKGEQIISKANSPFENNLDDIRLDYSRYTTTTIAMLSHMFDDVSIARSFGKFDMSYSNRTASSPFEEHQFYAGIATEQVNELKGILESLKFIPETSQRRTSTSSTVLPPPEPIKPDRIQSIQANDSNQSKTLKQKIEDHPIYVLVGTAVASASITVAIMMGLQSTRIDNEKSRYEAMIENQKKEYESQLRELRTKVKELESKTAGKDSNPSPSDK